MIKDLILNYQTPFYCYDEEIINKKIAFLKKIKLDFKHSFCFAVKANPNLAIINYFKKNNIGATVVSSGELFKAIRAGIDPSKIIMNGSSKNDLDLKYAITQKINSINIENLAEFDYINSYSKEKSLNTNIGIRINPGIDGDTFSQISTGRIGDKFGIEVDQIDFNQIKNYKNINLKMLSIHIGSQINDHKKLLKSYKVLIELANYLNKQGFKIEALDFGGGFSVLDNSSNNLNYNLWSMELNKLMKDNHYKILFEPGRFLIAESGSLVSKINYIKKSGKKNIVLMDSSFSEYLRPALYGIKPIVLDLNEQDQNKKKLYDIAGGVCESTDFFIKDIELNELKVGQYLIFKNVGAYGSSMSSTYNSRPRPLEILFNNKEHRAIRSRDNLEDLCKNEIM